MNAKVNPDEIKARATQAHYCAQYIAAVHGDPRYLEAIKPYFLETESGFQPMVKSIVNNVVSGHDSTAQNVFSHCADQYAQNYSLINDWARQAKVK